MLFKYTFPVTTSLVLTEEWPILVEGLRFEWHTTDDLVTAVSVTVQPTETDRPPNVVNGPIVEIHMGDSPQFDRVEKALRTVQGLLHLFASIEINFDHYEANWIPESEEDRAKLNILSYKKKEESINPNAPRRLSFEYASRILFSINAAENFEIPLNFLRRGSRDILAKRYIEAFYNFFFFLETLYAPGFSNPEKVKKKISASPKVNQSFSTLRSTLEQHILRDESGPKIATLLALSDEELISHLVDLRGNLHHHALRRPGIWHPDKPDEFRAEVLILQHLVHKIAMAEMMPILFSEERDKQLYDSAEQAGAILKIRVEKIVNDGESDHNMEPIIYRIPGKKVSKEIINHINTQLRLKFPDAATTGDLRAVKITSDDGSIVYGTYERF